MKFLALYDPATRQITGRIKLSNPEHAANYPNAVEITPEEFDAEPETRSMMVDPSGRLRTMRWHDQMRMKDLPE